MCILYVQQMMKLIHQSHWMSYKLKEAIATICWI